MQASLIRKEKRHAWAIELIRTEYRGWAGVFNWLNGIPQGCQSGLTIALFEKREDARQARRGLYGFGPRRAVVRKVRVSLEVLPERPDQRAARFTAEEEREERDGART